MNPRCPAARHPLAAPPFPEGTLRAACQVAYVADPPAVPEHLGPVPRPPRAALRIRLRGHAGDHRPGGADGRAAQRRPARPGQRRPVPAGRTERAAAAAGTAVAAGPRRPAGRAGPLRHPVRAQPRRPVAAAARAGGPGARAHPVPAPARARPGRFGAPARGGRLRPAARTGPGAGAAVLLGLHGLRRGRADGLCAWHGLGQQRRRQRHQCRLPDHAGLGPATQPAAEGVLDAGLPGPAGQYLDGVGDQAAGLGGALGRHARPRCACAEPDRPRHRQRQHRRAAGHGRGRRAHRAPAVQPPHRRRRRATEAVRARRPAAGPGARDDRPWPRRPRRGPLPGRQPLGRMVQDPRPRLVPGVPAAAGTGGPRVDVGPAGGVGVRHPRPAAGDVAAAAAGRPAVRGTAHPPDPGGGRAEPGPRTQADRNAGQRRAGAPGRRVRRHGRGTGAAARPAVRARPGAADRDRRTPPVHDPAGGGARAPAGAARRDEPGDPVRQPREPRHLLQRRVPGHVGFPRRHHRGRQYHRPVAGSVAAADDRPAGVPPAHGRGQGLARTAQAAGNPPARRPHRHARRLPGARRAGTLPRPAVGAGGHHPRAPDRRTAGTPGPA